MRFLILIISFTLILCQPNQEGPLIDLRPYNINVEDFDCSNAVVLFQAAKEDMVRLQDLNTELTYLSSTMEGTFMLIVLACQEGFATDQNLNQFKDTVKMLIDEFETLWETDDPYEKEIKVQIQTYFDNFVNETITCSALEKFLKDVNQYIDSQLNQVEKWLLELLPNRVKDLNETLETCKAVVSDVQIGSFNKDFNSANYTISPQERIEKVKILFSEHFYQPPIVAVSIKGFELHNQEPGIFVEPIEISTTGFFLQIKIPAFSVIKILEVEWLATLPQRSGITVTTLHLDKQTDPELRQVAKTDGDRTIKSEFKFKNLGQKEVAMVAISGFQVEQGIEMNIDVSVQNSDQEKFDVVISNKGKSVLSAIRLTILTFGASDRMNVLSVSSQANGPLSFGSNARKDVVKSTLDLPSIIWPGLAVLDFRSGFEYRLSQAIFHYGKALEVEFSTWGSTQINKVTSNLFYTPAKFKDLVTQQGTFRKVYSSIHHIFSSNENQMRVERYPVSFEHVFELQPSVAVAIKGFELKQKSPGVQIIAEDVTLKGFILKIIVPPEASLDFLEVDWLATLSEKSGIYISTLVEDSLNDEELKAIGNKEGHREFTRTINHPHSLKKPGVYVVFSGFRLSGLSDISLEVIQEEITKTDCDINVEVWSDSKLKAVSVTILHFDQSSYQNYMGFLTEENGVLSRSGANRAEKERRELGLQKPLLFAGLNYLDFESNKNPTSSYKISENIEYKENILEVEFYNNGEGGIRELGLNVFYTVASKSLLK